MLAMSDICIEVFLLREEFWDMDHFGEYRWVVQLVSMTCHTSKLSQFWHALSIFYHLPISHFPAQSPVPACPDTLPTKQNTWWWYLFVLNDCSIQHKDVWLVYYDLWFHNKSTMSIRKLFIPNYPFLINESGRSSPGSLPRDNISTQERECPGLWQGQPVTLRIRKEGGK